MSLRDTTAYIPQTDGSLAVANTIDLTPAIERARGLRLSGMTGNSDNRHVASVPMELINELLKQNGVKWSDKAARDELLKKKLMDGTLANFRVWEGSY